MQQILKLLLARSANQFLAERESTVVSTSVATVPKARRTIPVPRRSRSAPKSPPAAPKSSSVPEPKGPPSVSRASQITSQPVAPVPKAQPAAGVPVPRSSSVSRNPRVTSTAVSVSPSASGKRVTPRTRSRSPVERRGVAKKVAAGRPPLKRSKRPSTTEEEPEAGGATATSSSSPSVIVPSESHRGIIDKTALPVAKGGEGYEDRILREQSHSRFYFLKPGDVHRPYYEQKLAECRARVALASGTAKASAPVEQERPLVALDYHHTIEFNQTVSEVTVRHVQDIQRWGYDLTICSFSSNTTTQEKTLRTCREIEKKLLRPFVGIHITRTKLLSDQEQGPSITGDTGAKAIVLKKTGACVFCDDQQEILDECLSLQSGRARGNRVKCIKARFGAQQSLDPLVRFLADREVGDFPLPSTLKSLR